MSQSIPSTYRGVYSRWFYLPAAVIFVIFFLTPTAISFFFAFTRWTLFDWEWIGFENFEQFFKEPALTNGLRNTIIYAAVTSSLKVVLGLLLAVLLTSRIRARGLLRTMVFIPVLVSTVAVGVTFEVLLHPSERPRQRVARRRRHRRPGLADRPSNRLAVGGARRCLEGCGARHADLHRRHRLDPH